MEQSRTKNSIFNVGTGFLNTIVKCGGLCYDRNSFALRSSKATGYIP